MPCSGSLSRLQSHAQARTLRHYECLPSRLYSLLFMPISGRMGSQWKSSWNVRAHASSKLVMYHGGYTSQVKQVPFGQFEWSGGRCRSLFLRRRAQGARAGRDRLSFRGWLVYGTEAERKEEWKSHLDRMSCFMFESVPNTPSHGLHLTPEAYVLSFDKLTSDKVGEFLESRHTTLRLSCRSTFVLDEYLMPSK